MAAEAKKFDALEMSRRLREATSRRLAAMNREEQLAFLREAGEASSRGEGAHRSSRRPLDDRLPSIVEPNSGGLNGQSWIPWAAPVHRRLTAFAVEFRYDDVPFGLGLVPAEARVTVAMLRKHVEERVAAIAHAPNASAGNVSGRSRKPEESARAEGGVGPHY